MIAGTLPSSGTSSMVGAPYVTRADVHTDVILPDAVVAEGMPSWCTDIGFFTACRERLSDSGALAINLADDDPTLPAHIERPGSVFGPSHALVRCDDDGNFVAFAWKGPLCLPSRRVLFERVLSFGFAVELENDVNRSAHEGGRAPRSKAADLARAGACTPGNRRLHVLRTQPSLRFIRLPSALFVL